MRLTVRSAAAVAALAVGMPSLASAQQQQAQGSSEAQTALTAMAGNAANWVMPNGNYANTRYSELNQINKENVRTCRSPGPSRPACCAATRAARWSSAT